MSQPLQEPTPDPEPLAGPTIFARFKTWRECHQAWLEFLRSLNVGKKELWLVLHEPATGGRPRQGASLELDPPPHRDVAEKLLSHPGIQAFIATATRLAVATSALLPILGRFQESTQHAGALLRSLEAIPPLPTRADYEAAGWLARQLVHVDDRIWKSALSGEEDQRERRAFWDDRLARLKPTTDREAVAKEVDKLLQSPRNPDGELAFLNGLSEREAWDEEGARLQEIIDRDQSTPRGRYERWRELMELGLVRYARDGKCHFKTSAAQRFYDGPDDSLPHDMRWATEMRAATEALHTPASDAFPATALQPIHELEMGLGEAIDGHAVDLATAFKAVNLIVAELLSRCPKAASRKKGEAPAAETWLPDAHQKLVLALLKREGRLRTGVLWERVFPKHVSQRAHQNAMRELVDRKKVLTAGKGRATEYWLP